MGDKAGTSGLRRLAELFVCWSKPKVKMIVYVVRSLNVTCDAQEAVGGKEGRKRTKRGVILLVVMVAVAIKEAVAAPRLAVSEN